MDLQTVIIIGAVIVVGLALWLGRGLTIRRGPDGIEITTESEPADEREETDVSVGKDLELTDSEAGDITGEKSGGGSSRPGTKNVDVLSGGKVKNSKLGDITGIDRSGGERDASEPESEDDKNAQ